MDKAWNRSKKYRREYMEHKRYQITQWCHNFIKDYVKEGDICVDATVGGGNDTKFLCELVGKTGTVIGFDIQKEAIKKAEEKLKSHHFLKRTKLILDGHEHIANYVSPNSVSCIVFNLGYFPGGDHKITTQLATTIQAVSNGLDCLKVGGIMSLCIYSGGDSGFEEKEGLLPFLQQLDSKKYIVIMSQYYNRPNNPPIPVFIIKIK